MTRARAKETVEKRTARLEADRVRHEQDRLKAFANLRRTAVADSLNYQSINQFNARF